ncbi:MAG: transporter ATP-binding protein [Candidatus Saccharibacteria bacterium]|nr:transporter ATP-binding protein [Candidatus Saccharibacteria bacterium]
MAKAIIGTEHLNKTYGKKDSLFIALKDINLDIKQGESIAIIGKSGSGKSTLMHLLALLDSPTSGEITVNGESSSRLSRRQKDKLRNKQFGFVFQQFFLNANNSVLDNVILPLKIAGKSRRERNRLGMKALEDVELADKANNKANDLSGGQKQRVVIARALINDPNIIFADEPTGNLDSVTGQKIEEMLFSLNKTKNITLIIVTHDADLAARCDRQIRIKDGQIEQETK